MKIAIIGADGQLGSELCKIIPSSEQFPLTIKDIDITNYSQAEIIINKYSPCIVINTAAYHLVDDCEDNPDLALDVNGLAVRNMAMICKNKKIAFAHISTDYVFDGEKGSAYSEIDPPNPETAYGISKLAGELFVKYILSEYYIIRSCGLYGAAGCLGKGGGNFVENIIKKAESGEKIKVVNDEVVGPTYTRDLAEKIYELVKTNKFGLYHITNQGYCSWWEFASKIFELMDVQAKARMRIRAFVEIEKASRSDYKTKAHRPKYSVLENANLKKSGLSQPRKWEEALKAYLMEKGYL